MSEFTQLQVNDIRKALVLFGMSQEEVDALKGKKSVVKECEEKGLSSEDIETILETVTDEEEEFNFELDENDSALSTTNVSENNDISTPEYGSPDWNDWVMSMFKPDELTDGLPTVSGLRRLVESLLGEIVFSGAISPPHVANYGPDELPQATVHYEVHIAWKLDPIFDAYVDVNTKLPIRKFGGVGGSCTRNTRDGFNIYPEAMAETRAEVRALRKALALANPAAEEMLDSRKDDNVFESQNVDTPITGLQKKLITNKCEALNIDLNKFLKYQKLDKELDELTRNEATQLATQINKYQSNTQESEDIPKEIKG